jgi:hypothetical protein
MLLDEHNQYAEPPVAVRATGFNVQNINLTSVDATDPDTTIFSHISGCQDLDVSKWIRPGATRPVDKPSRSVYFVQVKAAPRDQLQIMD